MTTNSELAAALPGSELVGDRVSGVVNGMRVWLTNPDHTLTDIGQKLKDDAEAPPVEPPTEPPVEPPAPAELPAPVEPPAPARASRK